MCFFNIANNNRIMIKSFEQIIEKAKSLPSRKIAVVCPHDEEILLSLKLAAENGLGTPLLYGKSELIQSLIDKIGYQSPYEIIEFPTEEEAARAAVHAVSSGQADMLMKGLLPTSTFLKAVLHKDSGIKPTNLLSHICMSELPGKNRLIVVTDGGMNIKPTLEEKKGLIENAVSVLHKLDNPLPSVGVICAIEIENPKMPETVDAAQLAKWNKEGIIQDCTVEGPLALDNALSAEAAAHKGIASVIAGKTDILLVPDIASGNILGKSFIYIGRSKTAGIIIGASVPIIVTSRSDTNETKFHSIALAQAIS